MSATVEQQAVPAEAASLPTEEIKSSPEKTGPLVSELKKYPLPSNQDYLSYYVFQNEWKPTKPLQPIGAMYSSPGPGIVQLPSTIGTDNPDITKPRAPSYKMGARLKRWDTHIGPGPAAYDINSVCKVTNQGRDTVMAPKFGRAVRFREKDRVDVQSPGPAAYNRDPGDKLIYPTAPSFSMAHSARTKIDTPSAGPAPNAYSLPGAIGAGTSPLVSGPSYSMGKAKRMPEAKLDTNPGPAAYLLPSTDVNMRRSPGFYMGIKLAPPRSTSESPGPGARSPHLVKFDKYSTPRITFGIRHSPYKAIPGFAAE